MIISELTWAFFILIRPKIIITYCSIKVESFHKEKSMHEIIIETGILTAYRLAYIYIFICIIARSSWVWRTKFGIASNGLEFQNAE